jgi:DNA-binding CsgD family transcriptional regulator
MTDHMTTMQHTNRRSGQDRRMIQQFRPGLERRSGFDRRKMSAAEPAVLALRGTNDLRHDGPGAARETAARAAGSATPHPQSVRDFLAGVGTVVTQLVAGFYDASMDPKLWPEVLGKIRDAVHADNAAVVSHDFETGRGQLDHSVGIDAMFVTAYREFYSSQNIWLQQREKFTEHGQVLTSQQLADASVVVDTDFYRYWLRPQNLLHQLIGILDVQGSRVTLVSFARARDKGAFWDDDVDFLFRLLPYLRQGLRAGQVFRRVQDNERILLDTLDMMPIGIVLLGASGAVLTANRVAREIIDTEEALYVGSGGLGLKLATGRFRFRDFLAGALGASRSDSEEIDCFSVPRGGNRRPITLLMMPVKDRTMRRSDRDPAAVLFIGDPERPVDIDPRNLIRLYGLSRAEARVAVLLGKGLRLEHAAQHLGLTYETVRKHLKQIFSKTGTDRQAELVRTITSGPCGLRL